VVSASRPDSPDAGDDRSPPSASLIDLTAEELEQEIERVSELFRSDLHELGELLPLAAPTLSVVGPASSVPETARIGGASHGRSRRRLILVAAMVAAIVTLTLGLLISMATRAVPTANPTVRSVSTAMVVGGAGQTVDPPATTGMPGRPIGAGASATSVVAPPPTLVGAAALPSPPPLTSTPIVSLAEVLRRRVAVAEGSLQTGQLQATFDYGNGTQATASIQFDFGTAGRPAASHIINLYQGTTGSQRAEYLLIGDRFWRRSGDGPWVLSTVQEGILDQINGLLPGLVGVSLLDPGSEASSGILRWYDPARGGDATLQVDPATGIPQQFRLVSHANGAILTVSYRDWNIPQAITPPPTP
jgi:hypothetical protein